MWTLHSPLSTVSRYSYVYCMAAILVFALKRHKKVVYRLALYQVLASLSFATVETLQIVFINYELNPKVYGRLCAAIGWFNMYTRWVKLLFTMWVTVHLFCFGVLRKNLDRFEVLYVVTSLLVPAPMATISLTTNNYRVSSFHSYCYIYNSSNSSEIELIEKVVLWDAPSMVILMAVSVAMVALVIIVIKLLWLRSKYEPITYNDTFCKAIKELLPLVAFPILFFIFMIPVLWVHVYAATAQSPRLTRRT